MPNPSSFCSQFGCPFPFSVSVLHQNNPRGPPPFVPALSLISSSLPKHPTIASMLVQTLSRQIRQTT